MAEALTAVDDRHLTLLALDDGGRVVAMAEAMRYLIDPHTAEAAVAVADDHQHRGIGPRLLRWLTRDVADHGIERLIGFTQFDNQPALSMFALVPVSAYWLDEPGVYGFELPVGRSRGHGGPRRRSRGSAS